jgi:outer membrane protein assembly factor BamD
MPHAKLSVFYAWIFRPLAGLTTPLLAALLACAVTACSTTEIDRTAGMSPNRIYAEAKDEMNSGAYDKAVPLLEKLEGRAAGTPLAQQAQLDKAYARYKSGEAAEGLAALERFMKLHPASPAIDYALYLKGIINFNDDLGLLSFLTRQDLAERDQKASKESFEAFKELTTRFPESRYAPDARLRMSYIVNSLAQYEVHVARYYFNRGAYVAAVNRAQTALSEYRAVPALEEALFLVYKSYDALGMADLRDDAKRVLEKTYPQSEFLTKGAKTAGDPWWKLW